MEHKIPEGSMGRRFTCLMAGLMMPVLAASAFAQQTYDLILRNGRLLDGTGNPWYRADVAITGDRIAAVGDLSGAKARRVLDLAGLYIAPGFIDVHSHAGPALATPELSTAHPLAAEGITTVIVNPDGGGAVDLAKQRQALLKVGIGINVAQMVPHGSIRRAVLGMEDRAPTPAELQRMKDLVRAGMENGAVGLSSGPFYAPGSYAKTEELIELSRVASQYGGIYQSHIRDESDYTIGLVAAVDEVIRIAREANLPGIVTHIKALGPHVWGYSEALVKRIDRARAEGVQVFADQYPYAASGTSLVAALFPRWSEVGGDTAFQRRINDPAERTRLRTAIAENLDRRGGAARLQFTRYTPDPSIEGKTLQDYATAHKMDPIDAALTLVKGGDVSVVSFNMDEEDIATFMRQPWTMTCSDGGLVKMNVGVPHPRFYGTFPRKIHKYVEEEHVLSLPAAIRSMTSLPATVYHLGDRGIIRQGAFADIVVFDLARLRDKADYQHPHQLSEGVVDLLVNGKFVIDNSAFTDARPGTVVERQGRTGNREVGNREPGRNNN
jgi:N-acyl-D-aspartate/D-glutamate deacylase